MSAVVSGFSQRSVVCPALAGPPAGRYNYQNRETSQSSGPRTCSRQERFVTCTYPGMRYQTLRLIHSVCLSLAVTLLAATAHAQSVDDAVAHAGIGVGIAHYNPTSDQGHTSQ